jgi:hypothetical protein
MLKCDFLEAVECDTTAEFFRRVRSIGCNETPCFRFCKA